jgi:inosine-uridine nucleoside N-ribohydrolase
MAERIPIVLDVDTGIDDALAILYALRSERLEVLGITTGFGNVDRDTVTRNTLVVTEWAGAAIPVYPGATEPLTGARPDSEARMVHGANGLGDAPIGEPARRPEPVSAVEFLIETCRRHPGAVTIVTTARLTNLALALAAEPRLASWVARVVTMGGAFFVPGNVTPVAEANIWGDPEAADRVLSAGVRPWFVGLDVTHQVRLAEEDIAALDPAWPATPLLQQALRFYLSWYRDFGADGIAACPLHDPLAVAAAEDPDLLVFEPRWVRVETGGQWTRGMTVVDARARTDAAPTAHVARGVDRDRFLKRFRERLLIRRGL